jgi:apolipoprotein N-acyltransferase
MANKNDQKPETRNRKLAFIIAAIILFPILVSYGIYFSYKKKERNINVTVIQPNIDPYSEKFSGMDFEEQLNKMLLLAKQKVDSTTDYLVFPETALTEIIWENELQQTSSVQILKDFLRDYPNLKIITGASTYYMYQGDEKLSATARRHGNSNNYFDAYNTALQIDNSCKMQIYHKSKLVPGVERMPYPYIFGFLEGLAINLGGTTGSLGTQDERTVFMTSLGDEGVAPVICYESVFGEYVCDYIRNGASMIFIITNDGWWGNTPGYKQHLLYGRLRAIETRKWIARSANTGISCFINERGDFSQCTKWWTPAVISEKIGSNKEKTFYVMYGDIIGRFSLYASLFIFVFVCLKTSRN